MFLFNVHWPESMGGQLIFPPIWNFADACISVGVGCMLVFSFFNKKEPSANSKA
jgi:lipoprotein signal peptidase